MIAVVEIIVAMPGKTQELKKALAELVPHCRKEEGCLLYELYEQNQGEGQFLVLMKWKDQNALRAHEASKPIAHFVQKYDRILYGAASQTEWKPLF